MVRKENKFSFYNRVIQRFPVGTLDELFETLNHRDFEKKICDFFREDDNLQGILFASPQFYYEAKQQLDRNAVDKKLMVSLLKYFIRIHSRPTPFGAFSVVKLASVINTRVVEEACSKPSLFLNIDNHLVSKVSNYLLESKDLIDKYKFIRNPSVRICDRLISFVGYVIDDDGRRNYQVFSIEKNDVIVEIIDLSAKHVDSAFIQKNMMNKIADSELKDLLFELVSIRLLFTNIEHTVGNENSFRQLVSFIIENNIDFPILNVGKYIDLMNYSGLRSAQELLKGFGIDVDLNRICKVDSVGERGEFYLRSDFNLELYNAIRVLKQHDRLIKAPTKLDLFVNKFEEIYDGRFIKFDQLVYDDTAYSFSKIFQRNRFNHGIIDENPKVKLIIERVLQNPGIRNYELKVDDEIEIFDIENISYTILELCNEDNYLISGLHNSSPVRLIARFSGMNDDIDEFIEDLIKQQNNFDENIIYAQIKFFESTKAMNILSQKNLVGHSISLFTVQNDESELIELSDLYIGVIDRELILYSKKLGKRIIPILHSAHNFANSTNWLYQLLCSMQRGIDKDIGWNWGKYEENFFLPRITYKKFILKKARWRISKNIYKNIKRHELPEFLVLWGLPEIFMLKKGDQELVILKNNTLCLDLFWMEMQKSREIMIEEFISPKGKSKSQQIIVPLLRDVVKKLKHVKIYTDINESRNIDYWNDWLYIKFYVNENKLKSVLLEMYRSLKNMGLNFFYVFYRDPDFHIRLRIRGGDKNGLFFSFLPNLIGSFRYHELLKKYSVEPYDRELERYDPDFIENTELLFCSNSVLCLEIKELFDGDLFELAFVYTWYILKNTYNSHIGVKNFIRGQIGDKYSKIEMLDFYKNNNKYISLLNYDFIEYLRMLNLDIDIIVSQIEVSQSIVHKAKDNLLNQDFERWLSSVLHMFYNRFFVFYSRENERKILLYLHKALIGYNYVVK